MDLGSLLGGSCEHRALEVIVQLSSLCAVSNLSMADVYAGDASWRSPPAGPPAGSPAGQKPGILAKGQVHVWRASLDLPEDRLCDLERMLSPDELIRAERLRFARDRRQFIAARGLLRILLGSYLEVDPRLLRFRYGRWGKPFLSPMPRHRDLYFNLSHSGGLALYAVARAPVGIDVERICDVDEMEQIARRFLSPGDRQHLSSLPVQARQEAFFGLWTRQEALAKATGEGLAALPEGSSPLTAKSFGLGRTRGAVGFSRWTLHPLFPGPGYAAALAVRGCCRQIECLQLSALESEHM